MKNKKGFTLVELIVSFVLITVLSLALFRTVLTMQEQQQRNIAINKYKAFTVVLNNEIQRDFLNDKIEKISSCGVNCYDIVYSNRGVKKLTVDTDNNIVIYGSVKEELPNDYKFMGNVGFTTYTGNEEGYDSFVLLTISVKSNFESSIDEIKYMYQYDSDEYTIDLSL